MGEGQKMAIVPHFMYLLKIALDGGWVVQKKTKYPYVI